MVNYLIYVTSRLQEVPDIPGYQVSILVVRGDDIREVYNIAGMYICGFITSGSVKLTHDQFSYILTRVKCESEEMIFSLDDYHKKLAADYLDKSENVDSPSHLSGMAEKMGLELIGDNYAR